MDHVSFFKASVQQNLNSGKKRKERRSMLDDVTCIV